MELVKNIFFNTDKIVEGATVKISYIGYLFQNSSSDVYLHYGYGENWNNIGEIKTEKTELGYQAEITIPYGYKTLNLCYKNEAGQWDNNNGNNYIFDVEPSGQNAVEANIETVSETNIGTVVDTKNEIETETNANLGAPVDDDFDIDFDFSNNYSNVGIGTNTANNYNVYDIYETNINNTNVTTGVVESTSGIKNVDTEKTTNTSATTDDKYLTVAEETGMQIRKGLRRTYLWSKKIKLAIYKIIKYVPKIISGNYKRKVNE